MIMLSVATLPPNESSLPLQLSNLFSKQSKNRFQSCLVSFPDLIGMPRYFIWNVSSLHLKITKMRLIVRFLAPKQINALFEKLMLKSDQASKQQKLHFM